MQNHPGSLNFARAMIPMYPGYSESARLPCTACRRATPKRHLRLAKVPKNGLSFAANKLRASQAVSQWLHGAVRGQPRKMSIFLGLYRPRSGESESRYWLHCHGSHHGRVSRNSGLEELDILANKKPIELGEVALGKLSGSQAQPHQRWQASRPLRAEFWRTP